MPDIMRFNKCYISYLILLLLTSSCTHSSKEFSLEGNLKNVSDDVMYLFGTQPSFDRIDTIHLKNGAFKYRAELDTLATLTLLFNNGTMIPIFADKGIHTTLEGDATLPDSILISGGDANEEFNSFKQRIREQKLFTQQRAVADTFICSHPISPVSVYLLDKYFIQTLQPDYQRGSQLIEKMSGILHDDPLIILAQKEFADITKTDTARYISNFRFRNLKDEYQSSYQFRDKVLVILFWATWNNPSTKLKSELQTLQQTLKKKKEEVSFIFYSLDIDKKRWMDTVTKDTIYGEQVYDENGWNSSNISQFGIEKLPTVVVMNPQRKIISRSTHLDEISSCVDSILKMEKERKNKTKIRNAR